MPLQVLKAPTGIMGLDAITRGGLPRGRTTLVEGSAGTGKTVLAMQTLIGGIREHGEPGIFVAFEESAAQTRANLASFGWDLPALEAADQFFLLDARPNADLARSGSLDLCGLLAALDAKVSAIGAKRIVFDAIDVVMALVEEPIVMRREIYRLHEWLLSNELTAIMTCKAARHNPPDVLRYLGFIQFLVDCSVEVDQHLVQGVSQRTLRVVKYRGSGFDENEAPMIIGARGVEVAYAHGHDHAAAPVTHERLSAGVDALDTMLGGGYYRGASVLITGSPGTAKTTLCGAFAAAACRRGERTLFVSFDSRGDEVVRNLGSVGLDLGLPSDDGLLKIASLRSIQASAEIHLMRIRSLAEAHGATCLVVDPVSALSKEGNARLAHSVVERLIDWAKHHNITLMCTSLLDKDAPDIEGTPLQISTIADTWIHLSYVVHAGERNRGLSIVKSRGTHHSNQVRELLLHDGGIDIEDVYTAGGEVLMGTLRFEKERAEELERRAAEADLKWRRQRLEADAADLEMRLHALEQTLAHKRAEQDVLNEAEKRVREELATTEELLRHRREDSGPAGETDDHG